MLIAVCCDRGAPGSTTTALALGAAWGDQTVVLEADPYGGDLALRITLPDGSRLPERPTVATVAELARTTRGSDLLEGKGHHLTSSMRVIPGYLSAELATGIADWAALAGGLERSHERVVADLGRIHSASPSVSIAAAADVLVVVTRPDMDAFKHLVDRIERLVPALVQESGKAPVLVPVVVAEKRWIPGVTGQLAEYVGRSEVSTSIGHVGGLAWDPAGVKALESGRVEGRDAKHALRTSAVQLAAEIDATVQHTNLGVASTGGDQVSARERVRIALVNKLVATGDES